VSAAATAGIDFQNHCLNVVDVTKNNVSAPPNLYITPSVVNSEEDVSPLENALMDGNSPCGCRSDAWRQAVGPLRAAMAATAGAASPTPFFPHFSCYFIFPERARMITAVSVGQQKTCCARLLLIVSPLQ
jgi:hypothetical protein